MIKMDMQVDLGKIKGLKRMLEKYPQELESALEEGILNIALSMEAFAKQKIKEQGAVDLGQLLNSITVKRISTRHALVGTNVLNMRRRWNSAPRGTGSRSTTFPASGTG